MANRQDNELYIKPESSHSSDRETPEPLRIHKKPSTSAFGNDQPVEQWASYRLPSSAYGAPTSPPPSGPLPYPDERTRRQQISRTGTPQDLAAAAEEGRARGPPSAQRNSMASDASSGTGSGAGTRRARFDASDPNRPTVAGFGHSPTLGTGGLGERRGAAAKTISPVAIESPGGPEPPFKSPRTAEEDDDEDADGTGTLFAIPPVRPVAKATPAQDDADLRKQYYPPPLASSQNSMPPQLQIPKPSKGISRLDSTASVSTTKASRGSPPPPETPVADMPPSNGLTGIEARYAASGIAGTNTLDEMQAMSAAAAARRAHYASPQPQRGPAPLQPQPQPQQRPISGRWSPTERPGSGAHGPPILFQGNEEVQSSGNNAPSAARRPGQDVHQLETDVNRLNINEEPPPAYSPPALGAAQSQYPNEKGRYATPNQQQQSQQPPQQVPMHAPSDSKASLQDPNLQRHPAFANDTAQQQHPAFQAGAQQQAGPSQGLQDPRMAQSTSPQPPGAGPASPPPLPEGWIAHLDNNSGQYYYIHLPTQSTQWEFPKGPTPLSLQEPMSPTGSYYKNPLASPTGSMFTQPIASPGFASVPLATGFDSHASMMGALSSPTTGAFTGPPPSAGVDLYRIAPTNGVYFGPYLRYTNIDLERGLWLGSIMVITDAQQPPTIHIHQSVDLSPNPRQLKAHPIHSHQRWIFYRYDVDLRMEESGPAKWTYAITSHLGCTRYEFLVAGRHEASWRFLAHSGNDFAINVSANERTKLGGVPLVWKDVLVKHQECGGFHTQVGLGGQIYADRLWKDIPALKQWTQISGKENRKNAQWTPKMDEDVTHAYFHYYTSHFDQPAVREAFAQIPHVCCLDDQDIFDGYGSYPEYMQQSHVFKNVGRIGIDMYLLFQHHTTHEILRNVNNDIDLFTITGTGWHFLKYFGPNVVIVGPDTRSERSNTQVMAGATYQGLFPKVAVLPPSVQHCIWLFPVPLIYPRLEAVEHVASTMATGKKLVTGAFNMAGKVTGGLAGVVGAKGAVNSGFEGVKRAVGKSGLMQGVLNPFGEVDVLDELRDLWTHDSKDLERTYIIRTLQGVSHNKSLRMTFLSGSVNVCGAGLVHDPARPHDHKTMYQLITASIVNAPPPSYVIKLLHSNKALYIPQNGHRSSPAVSDTKEDMMEIFAADVNGQPRDLRRLMGRRNYLVCCAFDPELVQDPYGGAAQRKGPGNGRFNLAAEFMVQNEGLYGQAMKYGPVVIPSLEYGR